MSALFSSPEERAQALVIGAAVAAHALICARGLGSTNSRDVASAAFDFAEQFIDEAERRTVGKLSP